jgi:hypothetical protein
MEKKFQGKSFHRTKREPLEKCLAQAWEKANTQSGVATTLAYLLDPEHPHSPDVPTDRDWEVASTVIQWLGSPVGQGFLKEALAGAKGTVQEAAKRLVEVLDDSPVAVDFNDEERSAWDDLKSTVR